MAIAYALSTLGWLLVVLGALTFFATPWLPSAAFEPFKNAVPAGVVVALAGHLLTQARAVRDAAEKKSQFYLDACVEAYEQARNLLADGNNDRTAWIAAGRALAHAKELANRVSLDAHQRVLELHKLKYRASFDDALREKPAQFFYGATDHSIPLDEAAAASTARQHGGGRTVTSTIHELSEYSVYAVWEAAQWPTDYEDPLDRKFTADERAKLRVLYPGLNEFLEHRAQWASASGRLFPRNGGTAH